NEVDSYQLVGEFEANAAAEKRKFNLACRWMSQTIRFSSDEVKQAILNNTPRHVAMRIGDPDTAELLAKDLGIPSLDFHEIHHTDATTKMMGDGYEQVETETKRYDDLGSLE